MLTPKEIQAIVESGEGYNAEFKEKLPGKVREISQEICAFANAAGGTLLLGVSDDNQIKGFALNNVKRSAIQDSIQLINPQLHCPFYKVIFEEKEVWVIEISSGPQKPYTLSGAIYIRQGPNTQKITSVEQMRDFFQQANRIYFDESPCPGFDVTKDLEEEYFEEFRAMAKLSPGISREQILSNLKLQLEDTSFKNGAVLFFTKQPDLFFEKAVIRAIAFASETKAEIIDDKILSGPLMWQYRDAMTWLRNKLNVRYEIEGAGPRKEHWEIPEIVFKEAIINALAHRDYYDKGGRITIELHPDRVEISNPGGLVSAIAPKDFGKKSHSRNPLIFGLFERIQMVEQVGSGISRIKESLNEAGLPKPEFNIEGMFTLKLTRPIVSEKTSEKTSGKTSGKTRVKTPDLILNFVRENQEVTIEELASKIGITTRSIERNILKLKEEGKLERIGSDKGGYWKITEK